MFQQACKVRQKIFMLIAAAGGRPLAVAVAAQIERHRMLDRHAALEQRVEKMIPAPSLITHPVNENIGFFLWIAPFPVVKFQAIMSKVALPWLQIHKSLVNSPFLPSSSLP